MQNSLLGSLFSTQFIQNNLFMQKNLVRKYMVMDLDIQQKNRIYQSE